MAREEITVFGRIEMLTAMVAGRAHQIATYLETLEGLDKYIPKGPERELFQSCIRSIRADVNSLANDSQRSR